MHPAFDSLALWAIILGVLLTSMALAGTLLARLPLSTAMLYLAVGFGLGPAGLGLLTPDALQDAPLLERCAEVAVLISLFAAGLKLGLPLRDPHWRLPLRLALISMVLTIGAITLLGVYGLGLSLGAAVLLGGILAPTDPVLASDVQVADASDRDRLRFSLTGEGGLNDGAAFPFVMLGLGLMGLHELGAFGWRWVLVDVLWVMAGGLVIGAALGACIGWLVVYLRSRHQESVGLDEFLALGLVALAWGVAVACQASGFLAVFAAGLALQRTKEQVTGVDRSLAARAFLTAGQTPEERATDPAHASAHLMQAVRGFNEQLERIGEVAVVLVAGALLVSIAPDWRMLGAVLVLFVVIRPLAVWLGTIGAPIARHQRLLIAWLGIRGIGSIYYLMFAISHGIPRGLAAQLVTITLSAVALSVVLHGVSVTPLMNWYERHRARRASRRGA